MQHQSGLAIKIGILVMGALILLIGFSLRISDGVGGKNNYPLTAHFEEALGLEEGADVSLRGVRVGKVQELRFDPKRHTVVADMMISNEFPLPDDSVATVERSALLGNSIVVIKYGDSSRMVASGGELKTKAVPGLNELVASVTDMSAEAKSLVESFKANQDKVLGEIQQVIDENREDIRKTTESMASAGPKLEALADRLNEITANMSEGKGTIGKLYADEALYNDLKGFAEEAKKITADVRDGDGSLHKLIYEDSLATSAQESFDKLGSAGEEVEKLLAEKRGDIDKLIESLQGVGPDIKEAAANLKEISSKVNGTEGTLGLLVNDPSLYNDAKKTVRQVGDTLENGEEQGVIRSFLGVIFGALI